MLTDCIKCGGTGKLINGTRCDCKAGFTVELPVILEIPPQYQGVQFDKSFLPGWLQEGYGTKMETLLAKLVDDVSSENILICAPPNSGKTVFAYTLYAELYKRGHEIAPVMDLMQVRDYMLAYYNVDTEMVSLLSNARLALIKIPMDLPPKFAETMSTIIERRVRAGGTTVFLYSGSIEDLDAQDRFGKLAALKGDGNYNSLLCYSWKQERKGTE